MPRLNVGKLSLHYLSEGEGEPILFLHAFPLHAEMWRGELATLADGWRTIALDARGFGGSVPVPEALTMEMIADDAAALLEHLRLERAVVVGLSMGGYAALAFARRHAARLRALVLADTRASADTEEGAANRLRFAAEARERGAPWAADQLLPKLLSPGADQALVARVRQLILEARPEAIAAAQLGMARRADQHALLPAIRCPTLVICGQQDGLTPLDESRALTTAIPGARLTELPGGHLSNLESGAAFAACLRAFVAGLA